MFPVACTGLPQNAVPRLGGLLALLAVPWSLATLERPWLMVVGLAGGLMPVNPEVDD